MNSDYRKIRTRAGPLLVLLLLTACSRPGASSDTPSANVPDQQAASASTSPGVTGDAASADVDAAMATCSDIGGESTPRVTACTSVIESRAATSEVRARALNNRGVLFAGQDQYDRAIDDYDAAIAIDARYAAAFYNRAQAWRHKGNNVQADDDTAQAVGLDPGLARFNRR